VLVRRTLARAARGHRPALRHCRRVDAADRLPRQPRLAGHVGVRGALHEGGFRHDVLVDHGGARVWYLDKGGPAAEAFRETVRAAMTGGIDPDDPVWRVSPFVDYPGDYGGTQYRFEWEREWRVSAGLSFGAGDVAFLFIPEAFHRAARSFFEGHLEEGTGPAYLCPYVDPTWDMARIQAAYASLPASPPAAVQAVGAGACDYCGEPTVDELCLLCGNVSLR
jgi:hypothetical protein